MNAAFAALGNLCAILYFGLGSRLPLHVAWAIGAAGTERPNMVHHVARTPAAGLAGAGTWVRALEARPLL